tara:strand:- start:29 stop:553 length:525 start_codon:yes stop_codon:yes gene_type:complete
LIPFPNKKYNIIYVDPAWNVKNGWSSTSRLPQNLPYPTMSLKEIENLPIKNISEKNCKLFIWTINKYLPETFNIIKKWDFNYSTTLLWIKKPRGYGLGGAFATNVEYLIYAKRGKVNFKKKNNTCWWHFDRSEHSKKPNFYRDLISKTFNEKDKKIELFARTKVDGWDCWGNEV